MMNWYGGTNPFIVLIKQFTWVAQIRVSSFKHTWYGAEIYCTYYIWIE